MLITPSKRDTVCVMSHTELLGRIPMFEDLGEEDRNALASSLVERRFSAGTMIMNQGDEGTSMFIVAADLVEGHLDRRVSGRARAVR